MVLVVGSLTESTREAGFHLAKKPGLSYSEI